MVAAKRLGSIAAITGIIVSVLGVIFYLQSNSVVGPTSSFMYSNPQWTTNGLLIAAIGAMLFAFGIFLWMRPTSAKKKNSQNLPQRL